MDIPLAISVFNHQRPIECVAAVLEENAHIHKHDVLKVKRRVTIRRGTILAKMACSKNLPYGLRPTGRWLLLGSLRFHPGNRIREKRRIISRAIEPDASIGE